jgi:hypothetical protein|tara:strand:+ start:434 stop:973 length:540 start_codon:yes stop_codon:yes gene_type:complete
MDTKNIENYLNSFGKQVVNRSKGNLQRAGKGGKLENSISFKVVSDADGFTVQFYMTNYGKFVDKGVSGTQTKRTFKNYKNKVIKSPYKYRNAKGHSQPPSSALDKWVVKKGIAPRDASGKFMKRKTITFLIARSIGRNGIQGISFFQKPLMLGMKEFGSELLGTVKEDIIDTLNKTTVN